MRVSEGKLRYVQELCGKIEYVPAPMKMNVSCSSMPVGISEETAKEAEDNVLPRKMKATKALFGVPPLRNSAPGVGGAEVKIPGAGNRCSANPRFSRSGRIAEQSKQGTRCNVKKLCLKLELLEHIFSPAATQVGA